VTDQAPAESPNPAPGKPKPRSRLARKYALLIGSLVSLVLLTAGSLEMWFSYEDTKTALLRIQKEKAGGAAAVIDRFVREIESQMGWTMHAAFLKGDAALQQRRFDFLRLLRQAPEITEIAYLDASGREQILVSRLAIDVLKSGKDLSSEAKYQTAQKDGQYYSPVYFRRDSEPYLSLALRGRGREKGITVAEVNLKFVRDVISEIDVGQGGRAFVVDSSGLLIAHPDMSLVLRKTDLSQTEQIRTARNGGDAAGPGDLGGITTALGGNAVLSSHAVIRPTGWLVFIESPLSEAFRPLYNSLIRTGILIGAGILLSLVAGLLLARKIVRPIRALQQGAERIGAGALDYQIDVRTGDELEALADEFNEMTGRLRQSYDNVERVSALKRYFSPHLADLIVASDEDELTKSHRREISVLFCDLRNFTEFSSTAEPEEAMRVLEQYYVTLGTRLREFEATIGHFAGDGLMAFFNDPLPCPDHAERAVKMAVVMRDDMSVLLDDWRKRGLDLGFGIGVATGFATLGHIGTEEQFHYTAIGSVVNLASRLCDEAKSGEILISEAVHAEAGELIDVSAAGEFELKGFPRSVPTLRVDRLTGSQSMNS
jgi:class 3 adenylate cyclase